MGLQPLGPGLATLRVAPEDLATFVASHPGVWFSIWPAFHPTLDESAKLNGTLAYRTALAAAGSPLAGTGKSVVVGLVDTGLDVAHADFRDGAGHTRVAWLLDFSQRSLGRHPELETSFGCSAALQTDCAVLDGSDIDAAIAGNGPLPRDVLGHGTHVASIAAGNGGGSPNARFVGGAPEATLVIANVAHGPMGNSSDVDIATGVRFVFDRAEALGLPVVVNLSLGSDFGPHDGTTPLEQTMASMVGPDHPGRAIVVAAGNSGVLYTLDRPDQRLGIHTETRVTRGVASRVSLRSLTDIGSSPSGSVHIWVTYGRTDAISIGFDGAGGLSIPLVAWQGQGGAATPDNGLRAAIYNGVADPEGALAAGTHGAIVAWDGVWAGDAEMALRFEGEGFVEVWVEATPDGMSASFEEFFEQGTREGTITVPATHPDLISVGCTVNRTQWTDQDLYDHDTTQSAELAFLSPADSTCYFGSAGPTAAGARKPEISAPGAMVVASMSSDAAPGHGQPSLFDAPVGACPNKNDCLVVDATHALLSGSSMSAPQVTGAVALLFERDATLTQSDVSMLLEQGARRPRGGVGTDYQLGVGVLDVTGTMAALAARSTGIVRDPDAAASWMSLSDGYAHPDLGFSVAGAVEVRAADGSIADGFDEHRLSLTVSGEGIVQKPLSRVAAGLWAFEVRGQPSTGARSMQIDVRLDGVAIGAPVSRLSGHRSLPIGADRWIAVGSVRAYGGCSASGAKAIYPSTFWRLPLLLGFLGGFALFRRLGSARRLRPGVARLIDAQLSAAGERHLGQ